MNDQNKNDYERAAGRKQEAEPKQPDDHEILYQVFGYLGAGLVFAGILMSVFFIIACAGSIRC
mgnify:CR=1 FL=1